MLILAVTIGGILAALAVGALIIHRRTPHTSSEPVYETPIADFSWGKQKL
jgi:hypothetical protein